RAVHEAKVARVVDDALVRGATSVPELRRVLEEAGGQGKAGAAVLGRVLEERGPGYVPPESGLEARFVAVCRAGGLPEPRRQVVLGAAAPIGRVDFLFEE